MLTAILILVILSAITTSLAALFAACACGWAKAAHENSDYLFAQALKELGEAHDVLKDHTEYLDKIYENLLVTADTASAAEQLLLTMVDDPASELLVQNTLATLDTLAAVKSAKECLG